MCANPLVRNRAKPRCPVSWAQLRSQHIISRMLLESVQGEIIPMVTIAHLRKQREFPFLGGDVVKPDIEEEQALDSGPFEFTCQFPT